MACDIYGYPLDSVGEKKCLEKADIITRICYDSVRAMSPPDKSFILGEVAIRIFAAAISVMPDKAKKEMLDMFRLEVQDILNEIDLKKH